MRKRIKWTIWEDIVSRRSAKVLWHISAIAPWKSHSILWKITMKSAWIPPLIKIFREASMKPAVFMIPQYQTLILPKNFRTLTLKACEPPKNHLLTKFKSRNSTSVKNKKNLSSTKTLNWWTESKDKQQNKRKSVRKKDKNSWKNSKSSKAKKTS